MLVRWFLIPVACVALLALGPAQSQSSTDGYVMFSPDEVQWKGPLGPIGVVGATIYGDPSKPGLYVQRVKFPPHVFDRPHFHPEDRHVTVIKGTWYVGTGRSGIPKKLFHSRRVATCYIQRRRCTGTALRMKRSSFKLWGKVRVVRH